MRLLKWALHGGEPLFTLLSLGLVSLPCAAGAREEHRASPQLVKQQLPLLEMIHTGSTSPSFMEVLPQGKHNMAVPEVAREALSAAWQMVQGSSGQEEQAEHWEDPRPQGKKLLGKG